MGKVCGCEYRIIKFRVRKVLMGKFPTTEIVAFQDDAAEILGDVACGRIHSGGGEPGACRIRQIHAFYDRVRKVCPREYAALKSSIRQVLIGKVPAGEICLGEFNAYQ